MRTPLLKRLGVQIGAALATACLVLSPVGSVITQPMSLSVQAKERKKVRVGYMWGYHFQEGAAAGLEKSGFSYDYLQQVAAYSGWEYDYVYGSWEECYEMLLNGEIDIMSGISYTPERAELINFPDLPITNETYHIFVHEGDETSYPTLESLKGKKVGVSAGTLVLDSLKRWEERSGYGISIREYPDDETRLAAFERGETDATADLAMQVGADSGMIPVAEFGVDNTYIAVAKDRVDLLNDLNEAVSTINTTTPNYSAQLFKKYFTETAVMSTLSAEDAAWFEAHPTINVGYLENMAPFTVTSKDGEASGMYVDLIRTAMDHMELSNEIIYHPYKDVDSMNDALRVGDLDIAAPLYLSNWESEQLHILRSIEVVSVRMNMVSRGITEITPDTIIGISDSTPGQDKYVEQYYPENQIRHYSSPQSVIAGIRNGQVDTGIMSAYSISMYLKDKSGFVISELENSADLSIAVNPANTVLLRVLNRGIAAWGTDAVQESLLMHTDEAYAPTLMDFARANAAIVAMGAIAMAALVALLLVVVLFKSRQRRIADRNAHIDNMTELYNRRAYEEDISEMSSKPLPENLIVTVMDINGLKNANDNLGHSAGDEMITGLAWCIRETIHDPAFANLHIKAYRTGGDEFVIIVPASEEAFDLVNRSFMEHADAWQGELVKNVSVSMGTARSSEFPKATLKELIHMADNRMYQQKVEMHRNSLNHNQLLSPGDLISADVSREDAAMLNTYLKAFEAEFDRTTGLPGMTYFEQSVPVLRQEIQEQGGNAAVICLRLSDLNIFNITYGVQAGNELIADFAGLLARTFGKNHCARSGGNEMFVCTSDQALDQRLEELFTNLQSMNGGRVTTVKAGICIAHETTRESIESVCARDLITCDLNKSDGSSHFSYFGGEE